MSATARRTWPRKRPASIRAAGRRDVAGSGTSCATTRNRLERPIMMQSFLLTSAFLLTAAAPAEPPRRVEFTRLVDHLVGYDDPGYLKFIEDLKPEIVQVGWYGAHLYGPSPYEAWDHRKFSRQT